MFERRQAPSLVVERRVPEVGRHSFGNGVVGRHRVLPLRRVRRAEERHEPCRRGRVVECGSGRAVRDHRVGV